MKGLFQLYPLFCDYNRTKIELNKMHFFTLDEKHRFQLGQLCYKYATNFENFKCDKLSNAISKFIKIIFSKYKNDHDADTDSESK